MKYDAIKSLPKGLLDDVAKFLNREQVAPVELNEEVEQIDELSKGTLASYVKKAADESAAYKAGGEALQNVARAHRSEPIAKSAQKLHGKAFNRSQGIKKAVDKLAKEDFDLDDFLVVNEDFDVGVILETNEQFTEILFDEGVVTLDTADIMFEEIEQLNELSKDTLKSYMSKAQNDPAFAKKKGKPSKTTVAIRAKREKGMANAKEKLQAIVKAESEAHFKHMQKLNTKLDDHFAAEAPKILKKHGFEQIHSGTHQDPYGEGNHKEVTTFIKKHDNGHVTMLTLHKSHGKSRYTSSAHEARALTTKGASYSAHQAHHGAYDEKGFDKHMTDMMPKFEQHVIKVKEDAESPHNF